MASVRLRKGSAFWYACITVDTPAGRKQRQFSTGLTDEKEALAVATAAERAARRHAETPGQLREALERLADEFTPPEDLAPGPWLTAWADGRKGEVAPGTLEMYQATVKAAAEWMTEQGVDRFSKLTPAALGRLRGDLAKRMRPVTVNVRMAVLRAALNAAVKAGKLPVNPLAAMVPLKVKETRRREFRSAELDLLLPTLPAEWLAITLLAMDNGQRLNDLAVLRWRSVDLQAREVVFSARKTGKLVALPILEKSLEALAALPSSDDPEAFVFPGIAATKRSERSQVFRGYLAAVGLARPPGEKAETARETQELSFHSLRHTASTRLKAAGVSDAIARAIIGHESPAVSRAYTHFDMDTMRKAMEKMGT